MLGITNSIKRATVPALHGYRKTRIKNGGKSHNLSHEFSSCGLIQWLPCYLVKLEINGTVGSWSLKQFQAWLCSHVKKWLEAASAQGELSTLRKDIIPEKQYNLQLFFLLLSFYFFSSCCCWNVSISWHNFFSPPANISVKHWSFWWDEKNYQVQTESCIKFMHDSVSCRAF